MPKAKGPDEVGRKRASAAVAIGAATMTMAATSGIQAILYLSRFGVDGRTDGFFVAFGLYAIFGLFSQSIRVSSAPLLVGDERLSSREFAGALALIALPVAIATVPLAAPLSHLLAPGLAPADRAVTADALPLLGAAMVLHLGAAGGATLLVVRDRHGAAGGAYIAGALAGLLAYPIAVGPTGELALGWSMLAFALTTFVVTVAALRPRVAGRTASPLQPRRALGGAVLILGRTAIYLAFNGLFLISLGFVSGYDPGHATVFSYAFLYASYVVGGTAFSLGLSRIADMRREALVDARAVLRETVPPGFRYSMLVAAPALAALLVCAAPVISTLAPDSLPPGDEGVLRAFAALLMLWTVGALLVNLLLPAMFALGRAKLLNALALPLVAAHVAATAIGASLGGAVGAVGALALTPLCFAAVLFVLATSGDQRRELAATLVRDGARFVLLAAGCFGAGALVGELAGSEFTGALLAGTTGGLLYVIGIGLMAPRQAKMILAGLLPRAGPRRQQTEAAG